MKIPKWIIVLFLISISSVMGYFYQYSHSKQHRNRHIIGQTKYHAVKENKSFVIVVPSYNNILWYEKNLQSILAQEYDNYRVVYIDDASTDGTFTHVKEWLGKNDSKHIVELIKNKENRGALANIYFAAHQAQDHEIIVTVDGDDFLANEYVLKRLNEAYANPNVWMTYGSYLDYPSYEKGICRYLTKKSLKKTRGYRNHNWYTSHLRTFYAKLFKKIKLHDFLYQGDYFSMTWDMAFMLPMLEMAGDHIMYIEDYLYLYNRENPISDGNMDRLLQISMENFIRELPAYQPIDSLFSSKLELCENKSDLIVFSYNRPMQLFAFLESMKKYVKGLNQITVIYRSDEEKYSQGYDIVRSSFSDIHFKKQTSDPHKDFKLLVMDSLIASKSSHILFAVDDIIVKDYVDVTECMQMMKQTSSYAFYLRLGSHVDYCYSLNCHQNLPKSIQLTNNIFAWQLNQGKADWNYPNNVDMTLYRRTDVINDFSKLDDFYNPNTLEGRWAALADANKVGLYFTNSKIVNIPLNLVNTTYNNRNMNFLSIEQLLEKFMQGFKIDITSMHQIENRSAHQEIEVKFVKR